ncbi:kinetochore protein Nuf2-like [Elysia marginata]|uniref:Kinetochore protein Nuf2-like n=1 Tax=Elysia marginata TaxID=1093978 RepID=A0AAV4FL63_9GAST|nr:kinetochore protein Nuf2-like [Elysia marginata]
MTFESPQLQVSEILAAFKEFDIVMLDNDFRSPDRLRWREIYATMFEALSGISIESTIQTILKEVKMNSANPEAFEEAAGQIAFTQCLQRVMSGCGYKDISLKDIIHPGPKGVRRISSVFVNRSRHDTRVIGFIEETAERAACREKAQAKDIYGNPVCRSTFLFIHCLGKSRLDSLQKSSLSGRDKSKRGDRIYNTKALDPGDLERIVKYIKSFTEDNGLALPGRVPGYHRTGLKLLPSQFTKIKIWRSYKAVCEETDPERGRKVVTSRT